MERMTKIGMYGVALIMLALLKAFCLLLRPLSQTV